MRRTTVRHNEGDPAAEAIALRSLILEIFRTNGRILRAGDQLTKEFGITSARWQVLSVVASRPRTVAQIAREYEMTRQGVLLITQALHKQDLVELIPNPDHKRAKLVRLTNKGSALLQKVLERQNRWSTRIGSLFTLEELQNAAALMRRLGQLVAVNKDDE